MKHKQINEKDKEKQTQFDTSHDVIMIDQIEEKEANDWMDIDYIVDSNNVMGKKELRKKKKDLEGLYGKEDIIERFLKIPFVGSEDIKILNLLGAGSFGKVFSARIKSIKHIVAIKQIDIKKATHTKQTVISFLNELQIMKSVKCSYVLKTIGYSLSKHQLTIITPLMHGNLFNYMKRVNLVMKEKISISFQIGLGISSLHNNNILHRDLKSLNILYRLVNNKIFVVIADFGCSKLLDHDEKFNTKNIGTRQWRAPEVSSGKYSYSADIYSYGIIMVEIFHGFIPDNTHLLKSKIKKFIFECLNTVPSKRPTIKRILENLKEMRYELNGKYKKNGMNETENQPETSFQLKKILFKNSSQIN